MFKDFAEKAKGPVVCRNFVDSFTAYSDFCFRYHFLDTLCFFLELSCFFLVFKFLVLDWS